MNEKPKLDVPQSDKEIAARLKNLEGTCFESVFMKADKSLSIVTAQYLEGGGVGTANCKSHPGDLVYNNLLKNHSPLRPGQSHTLIKKNIDGEWVILDDNDLV